MLLLLLSRSRRLNYWRCLHKSRVMKVRYINTLIHEHHARTRITSDKKKKPQHAHHRSSRLVQNKNGAPAAPNGHALCSIFYLSSPVPSVINSLQHTPHAWGLHHTSTIQHNVGI